jgi:predicted RNase H-like nuclease
VATFVGIDLAWGTRNPSGICVITGAGCTIECSLATPAAIAECLDALGPDLVVGIDAPLIVDEGRRAESLLAHRMGRFGVFAHSSAAAVRAGYDQGIRLAAELQKIGFSLDPSVPARGSGRFALEVYPHAGHVVMFDLPRILRYKQKRGRTSHALNAELAVYRGHLYEWMARECAELPGREAVAGLLGTGALSGGARKRHEDQLDALTCALLAMIAWRQGLSSGDVVGDERGYIAVPGLARDPRFGPASGTSPDATFGPAPSFP